MKSRGTKLFKSNGKPVKKIVSPFTHKFYLNESNINCDFNEKSFMDWFYEITYI